MGLTLWSQGDATQAAACFRASLSLRHQMGERLGLGRLGLAECLEGLAAVAIGQGEAGQAARLSGAADALRQALGAPIPLVDRPSQEATVRAARAMLGTPAFDAAWAAGAALTLDQAVAAALEPATST
jgi:hypothetical protein